MHAVIFDIDGTLLASSAPDDAIYREAVCAVLGPVRLRSDLHAYPQVTDTAILLQVLADNGIAPDAGKIDRVKAEFVRYTRQHVARHGAFRPLPGVRELLRRLRASDRHRIAIATGGWRCTAEFKLDSSGIDRHGIPLATADDAAGRPAIMSVALARLGGKFDSITYFGDGVWDAESARQLGWTFRPVGATLGGIESYVREYNDLAPRIGESG